MKLRLKHVNLIGTNLSLGTKYGRLKVGIAQITHRYSIRHLILIIYELISHANRIFHFSCMTQAIILLMSRFFEVWR